MAWVRTGVALIGFGFTIVQFFQRLGGIEGVAPARRPQAPRYLGLALIGAGLLALIISGCQYRRLVRYLWSPQFRPIAGIGSNHLKSIYAQAPILAVVIVVTAIGIFAFFAVLLRMF